MRLSPEQRGFVDEVRSLAPPIYGGTNEIQREIISRSLGL